MADLSRWLATAVVVLAPLPFGSVDHRWTAAWCVAMAASLALAGEFRLSARAWRIVMLVFAVYILFAAVIFLQIGGHLQADPLWSRAAQLLELPLEPMASASRRGPLMELGSSLLFVMTFCRFVLLAAERAATERLLRMLAWSGLAYALWAAIAFAHDPTRVLWRAKSAYRENLTGTFINRNTAAIFFGSTGVIWFLALVSDLRYGRSSELKISERVWLVSRRRDLTIVVLFVGLLFCLATTAATGSRAGFVLTLVALLIAGWIYGRPSLPGLLSRPWPWLAAALFAAVIVEVLAGSVTRRMQMLGLEDRSRLEVYIVSLDLIARHPWLGVGLGNFLAVFPMVRPDTILIGGYWDRAHSTPLEMAVEMGLPLAGIVGLLWLWLAGKLAFASWRRRDPLIVAGFAIGLLGTLHSLVDFSLQIPGYSVFFAAVTGVGLGRACAPADTALQTFVLKPPRLRGTGGLFARFRRGGRSRTPTFRREARSAS